MSDELELLNRWRAGDKQAGSALFQRHYDSLFRFFSGKVTGDVRDLIQQTVLACVERRDAIESFRAYLFGTARLVLFGHYRERVRGGFDELATSLEDLAPSPSRLVDAADGSRALVAALRRLPLATQVLLELHYWERLTQRELAEATKTPLGTMKSQLKRAQTLLRRELGEVAPGGDYDPSAIDLERWGPAEDDAPDDVKDDVKSDSADEDEQ